MSTELFQLIKVNINLIDIQEFPLLNHCMD